MSAFLAEHAMELERIDSCIEGAMYRVQFVSLLYVLMLNNVFLTLVSNQYMKMK